MTPFSRVGNWFANPGESPASPEDVGGADAAALRAEQVRALDAGACTAVFANLLVGLLFCAVLHAAIPAMRLAVWFSVLVVALGLRLSVSREYRRRQPEVSAAPPWGSAMVALLAATAGCWGAAGFWLIPEAQIHQAFVGFVLAGMVAGAVSTLAVSFRAYAMFVGLTVSPFVLRQILLGRSDPLHFGMAALAAVFALIMLMVGERISGTFRTAMILRFRDSRRASELAASHAEVQAAFESLREEVFQRREAQSRLLQSEDRLRLYVEQSPVALIEWDTAFRVMEWNAAATSLFGYSREEALGRTASELIATVGSCEEVARLWNDVLRERRGATIRLRNRTRAGREVACEWHYTPLVDASGRLRSVASLALDATERQVVEGRVERLSSSDSLTGLANRTLFMREVARAVERHRGGSGRIAAVVLDLDRFKLINESMGHECGDQLLVLAAERVRNALPSGALIARYGEDEFAILLDPGSEEGQALPLAQGIRAAFHAPFVFGSREVFVTVSVGVAVFPYDGETPDTLLENAGAALSHAKRRGRDNVQCYSAELTRRAKVRVGAETRLRQAFEREEFTLLYQPVVDLHTSMIVGAEALLRWRLADRGLVSPVEFIEVAEESGLIVPLGEWALRKACQDLAGWQTTGSPGCRLSINLSARQFRHPGVVGAIQDALDAAGLPASCLTVELTETLLMENDARGRGVLEQLRARGVRVAIDDFGTGFCGLGYLRDFPVDVLKIDRSFVRDIPMNAADVAIVRAITAMARSLRLRTVAEGVESPDQKLFLAAEGCDEAQGFLFGRPMDAASLGSHLAAQSGAGSSDSNT